MIGKIEQGCKKMMRRIWYIIDEAIRHLSLRLILTPAAYILPQKWAFGIASILSLLLVISPATGRSVYWQMRRIFGKRRYDSLRLAWRYLGRGYHDFVVYKRVIFNRENPLNWQIIERNADNIDRLRNSGESYIVASGHFRQGLTATMYSPKITYGNIIRLAYPVAERNRNLRDLRNRYQYGTHHKATAFFLSSYARQLELISATDLFAAKKIYNRLCEAGNVVFIDVDAWPNINTVIYQRPFAGFRKRAFATGTAKLARMAQSTIISCIISQEKDGTITLEWGTPIRCMHNKPADDIKVMNILLDTIEVAIGEKPTQYALEIGSDRHWDPQSKQWKDQSD